jgi:hypothetical protein
VGSSYSRALAEFYLTVRREVPMYCPKCGQEQVDEVPNFCSRCGFQLTEVPSLLERGGAPGAPQENRPPRDKVRRCGLRLLKAALAFFVLAIFVSVARGNAGGAFLGFLTVASFVIGSCVLISSWIKGRMRRRSESGALPPAHSPRLAMPRARFDTGDLAQPPSVTEHTTRQLEYEPRRARARTRSID